MTPQGDVVDGGPMRLVSWLRYRCKRGRLCVFCDRYDPRRRGCGGDVREWSVATPPKGEDA